MPIQTVEAVPLRRELEGRFANAQKWIGAREYCLVRIEAEGATGWGECWGPVAGNRAVVEETVAPLVEGRDPRDVEAIHADLRHALRSTYHSYEPVGALSGVDIALWDLKGRLLGESVASLLGGRRREAVPAYATGGFFPDVDSVAEVREAVAEEAAGHVDAGFAAVKQKIGLARHFDADRRDDVSLVRAVRDAVGDDVRLFADANHAYDLADARWVADRLADLDVGFLEEPMPPERLDAYERLAARSEVPIAAGECWAFEPRFAEAADRGLVAYAQPDLTSAGGFTATKRAVEAVWARGVQPYPHVFGSAVALHASLQLLAAAPGRPLLEFDRTPNPIRDDLARDPVENDGAEVPIPEGPGIGLEVDPDVLAAFRID